MSHFHPWGRLIFSTYLLGLLPAVALAQDHPGDWPTYNRDVIGTRHNAGEKAISPQNAAKLEEKWRFPAKDSKEQIGAIHATPIVVNGYVYFGTATDPTFYKLTPDGRVKWSYKNPEQAAPAPAPAADGKAPSEEELRKSRFQSTVNGILGSALVTADAVFFGDTGGWIYSLDRASGAERWKLNTRAEPFPGAHPFNIICASPIVADGKLIVAGGAIEQVISAFPGYKGNTGRGYVMALEPATGHIVWKYDVGPQPEPFDPPIKVTDSWGEHTFYFGPATSSIWCTPSFDAQSQTIYFGTDVNTAPRRPTDDNPNLATRESCAVIALDAVSGKEKWVSQLNPGDVWTNAMRAYDPKEGRYKDQSIGDTPKPYTIPVDGVPTKVVGVGCKNGGFYVLHVSDGKVLAHTPLYKGPPAYPLDPQPDPRMLALPGPLGGLQTGCATDGRTVFTNGVDAMRLGTQAIPLLSAVPPTGGRVAAISLDTREERWRHEREKIASIGGPLPKPVYKDVGDPVASGIAVANGVLYFTAVASGKLVALEAASGQVLKEFDLGPVWAGPSVSRGRVYAGSGNTLLSPAEYEAYFPKQATGVLYCFGLPGDDEVSRLGGGSE